MIFFASVFLLFTSGAASAEDGVTADEIIIGGIMDLSGPAAHMGAGISEGSRLYFRQLNDSGGIYGRKIRYILEDDGFQVPRAVQACKKLVVKDKIFCMFGVLGSGENNALYPFLSSMGIPLVLPGAQDRNLGVPSRKYLFQAQTDYTTQGKIAVEYIIEDMKIKEPRIACCFQDDVSGYDWRNGVRIAAKHYKLKVLELPYKRGAVDFSSQVANCREDKVTHVLIMAMVREPALIMKEAQRIQYRAVYICAAPSTTKKALELAGDSVNYAVGLYSTNTLNDPATINNVMIRQYKDAIARYGKCSADFFENVYGYQTAMILCEGMRRAGKNLTREGFIKALETFRNYDSGFFPPITWRPDKRSGCDGVKIYRVVNGGWQAISDWRFSKIKNE